MSRLLIVTGPPGAGKTTVADRLADRFEPSVLVRGDVFFGFIERGARLPWMPGSDRQNEIVTRAAASAAGEYVRGGYWTVYDGFVGPWFLQVFLSETMLDQVEYAVLLPSVERCVERVSNRQEHGFDDADATRKMHRQFADASIEPGHLLIDPPDDPNHVADVIVDALERDLLRYPSSP
jgi:cytidylate kinase